MAASLLNVRLFSPLRGLALLILLPLTGWTAPFSTVVLDAGHGGHDRGGIRTNIIPEKGVALDTAKRVKRYLQDAGLRVVMTRSTDVFVPLSQRVAISNAQKNAVFVSIHYNSATRRGACGIETFANRAGLPLARRIQRNMMKTTSADDRGVKQRGFFVLRKNRKPAVLVECGFLTNPGDANRAKNPAYRDRIAREISRAILEYRRSL
jgi:N-acetylmuramoyl-L-alanine amidase